MSKPLIYLIGSLRNPEIPNIANKVRESGVRVFDDWIAAGPHADDCWRDYEVQRGHSYKEALNGHPAKHVFTFDEFHLNRCHAGVLVYPAGKSGHLELGWIIGSGKPGFILLDETPERYDVMKRFAQVYLDVESLKKALEDYPWPKLPTTPEAYQHEVMWLSGLWEGDGTFCISDAVPRMVLQMTDADVVKKAANVVGSGIWRVGVTRANKQVWACGVSGLSAIEWMRLVKPYMGQRRQRQINAVVSTWLDKEKRQKEQDRKYWSSVFRLGEN